MEITRSLYCNASCELISNISAETTDLLIIAPGAEPPFPNCNILLIPDEMMAVPKAKIAVSYGMSPKCSITLSSTGEKPILAIQREITTLSGKTIEPQEIYIQNKYGLPPYPLMAVAAAKLILGLSPDSLS